MLRRRLRELHPLFCMNSVAFFGGGEGSARLHFTMDVAPWAVAGWWVTCVFTSASSLLQSSCLANLVASTQVRRRDFGRGG